MQLKDLLELITIHAGLHTETWHMLIRMPVMFSNAISLSLCTSDISLLNGVIFKH